MPKSEGVEIEIEKPAILKPNDQVDLRFEKKGKPGKEARPDFVTIRWQGKSVKLFPGDSMRLSRLAAMKQIQILQHKTLSHGADLTVRELAPVSAVDGSVEITDDQLTAAAEAKGAVVVDKAYLDDLIAKANGKPPKPAVAAGPTKAEIRVTNEAKAKELGIEGYKDLSNKALVEAIEEAEAAPKAAPAKDGAEGKEAKE